MKLRTSLTLAAHLGGAVALVRPSQPNIVTPESPPLPANRSNPQAIISSPVNPPSSLSAAGIVAPPLNEDLPDYHCDGKAFGYDLRAESCYQALEIMPGMPGMHDFGHGREMDLVELPYRVSSPDGHCAIEIRLKESLWYTGHDHANFKDLKDGAVAVVAGCLMNERVGGVSRYQGINKRLEVTVERFDPHNIHCGTRAQPGPPPRSCNRLIEGMYPSKDVMTYGRKGDAGVIMPLPAQSRFPRKGPSCLLTINTIGGLDRASSYDLFKAAIAVDMLCARSNPPLQGMATQIGQKKQLTVSLSNGDTPALGVLGDAAGGEGSVETA